MVRLFETKSMVMSLSWSIKSFPRMILSASAYWSASSLLAANDIEVTVKGTSLMVMFPNLSSLAMAKYPLVEPIPATETLEPSRGSQAVFFSHFRGDDAGNAAGVENHVSLGSVDGAFLELHQDAALFFWPHGDNLEGHGCDVGLSELDLIRIVGGKG